MDTKTNTKTAFLSGNEALAQAAYEEGLHVACAYPGTPSTEILEYLSQFDAVDSQWSVNEKVAYEVAIGASYGGLRSLFACKHVGLNVAMDPLMTSAYTGVGAAFVAVVCDDPGLHSSQNEQDVRHVPPYAKIPLLEPSSPLEANLFMREALKLSEEFDIPVMIRMTTRVSHSKENVQLGPRKEVTPIGFKSDPQKYVMVPGLARKRRADLELRMERLKAYCEQSWLNTITYKSRDIGVVTSSVAYEYAKDMLPDASFLKLGMSYPFPEDRVREFASEVKELVVIEELDPIMEERIKAMGLTVRGKPKSFRLGELKPEFIPMIMEGKEKLQEEPTTRKPVMCPGCAHRPTFWILKQLKTHVTGDIGCYTLGALPPLASLHNCLCMGGGVTLAEGYKKTGNRGIIGVVGDSTFVHSGVTGLINARYNKSKGVLLILDNSTTAMTGSQPHPATGITIKGEKTHRLNLEELCKACGAENVDVVNPFEVEAYKKLLEKRLSEDKLSVVIARCPCVFVEKPEGVMPIYDREACTKCMLCLQINCPALQKGGDGYIVIDPHLCTGCNLCVQVCPHNALRGGDDE